MAFYRNGEQHETLADLIHAATHDDSAVTIMWGRHHIEVDRTCHVSSLDGWLSVLREYSDDHWTIRESEITAIREAW